MTTLASDVFDIATINYIRKKKELLVNILHNIIYTPILKTFNANTISYISSDVVFAGGMFASLFQEIEINDIDIFILNNNENVFSELKEKIFNGVFHYKNMRNSSYKTNPNILSIAEGIVSTNTLGMEAYFPKRSAKIQIILTDYKSRKELLDHFDFVHCKGSSIFDPIIIPASHTTTLFLTKEIYSSIMGRNLIPNNFENINDRRIYKFIGRGFSLTQDFWKNCPPDLVSIYRPKMSVPTTTWYPPAGLKRGQVTLGSTQTGAAPTVDDLFHDILFQPTETIKHIKFENAITPGKWNLDEFEEWK